MRNSAGLKVGITAQVTEQVQLRDAVDRSREGDGMRRMVLASCTWSTGGYARNMWSCTAMFRPGQQELPSKMRGSDRPHHRRYPDYAPKTTHRFELPQKNASTFLSTSLTVGAAVRAKKRRAAAAAAHLFPDAHARAHRWRCSRVCALSVHLCMRAQGPSAAPSPSETGGVRIREEMLDMRAKNKTDRHAR